MIGCDKAAVYLTNTDRKLLVAVTSNMNPVEHPDYSIGLSQLFCRIGAAQRDHFHSTGVR